MRRRCVRLESSRKYKLWRAKIRISGKVVDLGRYATRAEGLAPYKAARKVCPPKAPGRPKKQPPHRTLEDYPDMMIREAPHDHPAAMLPVI